MAPEIYELNPWLGEHCHQHGAIGIVNLSGREALSNVPKLVAIGKERDTNSAPHLHPRNAGGDEDGYVACIEETTCLDDWRPLGDILASASDIRSVRDGHIDRHRAPEKITALFQNNRRYTCGNRRPGEESDRLAWREHRADPAAGGNLRRHRKTKRGRFVDIVFADAESVDRRMIERRKGHACSHIAGKHTPSRRDERDRLGLRDGLCKPNDRRKGFIDGVKQFPCCAINGESAIGHPDTRAFNKPGGRSRPSPSVSLVPAT